MSRKEKLIMAVAILTGALLVVVLDIYDNESRPHIVSQPTCIDVYIDTNTVICK